LDKKFTGVRWEVGAISYGRKQGWLGKGEQEITKLLRRRRVDGVDFLNHLNHLGLYLDVENLAIGKTRVTWGF